MSEELTIPITEEQWKQYATQKSLDIVESFYNILKYRDDEIAKLREALHTISKTSQATVGNPITVMREIAIEALRCEYRDNDE